MLVYQRVSMTSQPPKEHLQDGSWGGLHVQGSIAVNNFDVNIWVPGCPRVGPAKLSCSQQWLMSSAEMSQHSWFFGTSKSDLWQIQPQWWIAYYTLLHLVDIEHPKWKIRNDDPLPPPNIPKGYQPLCNLEDLGSTSLVALLWSSLATDT